MTSKMIVLDLKQGSDEWKAIRGEYLVASEAPVIMGASPHMRRDELLHMKKTGDEKEINAWVERFVFRKGHEFEAAARPIAEGRLDEELYPLTGTRVVFGLPLLASFDGITAPLHDDSWEHKTLNEKLREFFESGAPAESLPLMYAWQLEHQLLVAGTDSCVFAASNDTEDTYHEIRYYSVPERREQLIEGWKLFNQDLENYEVKEVKPEVVGKAPGDLPALRIEVTGMVTASNLLEVKQTAMSVFSSINTELRTDEDFANAEKTIKWCSGVEERLEGAKQNALAQTASIDELFRTMDELREEARRVRLNLKNKVEDRKKAVKWEIAQAAKDAFDDHIKTLNKAMGGDWMPVIATDFNGAMKGKRTVTTLESAANDEFARARIEANRICSRIEDNLTFFDEETQGYDFLFADKKILVVGYDREPLQAIVKNRIAEHKAKEEAKAEAERQRIREEERVKAEREAAEKARKEKAEQDAAEQARIAAEQKPAEPEKAAEPEPVKTAPEANVERREYFNEGMQAMSQAELHQRDIEQAPLMQNAMTRRPPDDGIIHFLCEHYNEDVATVIGWLRTIDLAAAEKRLVKAA